MSGVYHRAGRWPDPLAGHARTKLQTRVIAPCFVFRPAARTGLARFAPNKNLRRLQTCEIGPCNEPARGTPVFSRLVFLISPEGACGTQGVSPRPRRHVGDHVASCAFQAHDTVSCWNSTRRTAASDAVHTPAFRMRRSYRLATPSGATPLGALTECWASPHCWVLGPPTSSAGRGPFTTLRPRTSRRAVARKARKRDGSVASRSCAGHATGAPLWPERDGKTIIPATEQIKNYFSENQKYL